MTDHQKLLHAIIEYDRKESLKPGYNPYTLAHALRALNETVQPAIERGIPIRKAILLGFCGRLATKVLKSVGERAITKEEGRGSLSDYGY